MSNTELRVWVACLACYNEGRLVGEWVEAIDADAVTVKGLHHSAGFASDGLESADGARWVPEGTHTVDLSDHEELWCMDTDGFGELIDGECSPDEAARVAALLADVHDVAALAAWRAHCGGSLDEEMITAFNDGFIGVYKSEKDYAMEHAEQCGFDFSDNTWPNSCIDWDHATRELFYDYWSAPASDGNVYVFHSA